MTKSLRRVVETNIIMPTRQNRVQEQRIDIRFKIPAIHLDAELVAQNERHGKSVVRVIVFFTLFRRVHDLLERFQIFIRDAEAYVRYNADALRNNFFPTFAPRFLPVETLIGFHNTMNHGKCFSFPEKPGISD